MIEKRVTQTEATQSLREYRKRLGMVRVEVWVHRDDRDDLIDKANELRGKRFPKMEDYRA